MRPVISVAEWIIILFVVNQQYNSYAFHRIYLVFWGTFVPAFIATVWCLPILQIFSKFIDPAMELEERTAEAYLYQ